MQEQQKYHIKTTRSFSYKQIFSVALFGTITIVALTAMSVGIYRTKDYRIILGILLLLLYIKMLIDIIIRWFIAYFTVELYEDRLIGYNLWKKKNVLHFNDIIKVGHQGFFSNKVSYHIAFWDKNNKVHSITGDIDYYGFIHDYILQRVDESIVDKQWVKKMRERYRLWKYTRRTPFNTVYEVEYLDWLHEEAQKQKEKMIQKGILKPGILYGHDVRDAAFRKIDK